MFSQFKASIVVVHGIWADGSSFAKVIPALQKEGHEVVDQKTSETIWSDDLRKKPSGILASHNGSSANNWVNQRRRK